MPYGYLVVVSSALLIALYMGLLFLWGWRSKQFRDVEAPKFQMLEDARSAEREETE